MSALITFCIEFKVLFMTMHILSMALGLGGATISDILFFKFLKDYKISKKEVEVLHILKTFVLTIIVFIVLSGMALFLTDIPKFSTSEAFLLKSTMVALLVINGIELHIFIAPHLIKLDFIHGKQIHRTWRRFAFALGAISVTSWYSTFLLAMHKSSFTWNYIQMMMVFIGLLVIAIIASQIIEHKFTLQGQI